MLATFWVRNKLLGAVLWVILLSSAVADMTAQAANGSVVYTYDALGRVTTASYDTGVIVIYAYDANGNRTTQVINTNSGTAVWNSFNWDGALWG